MKQTLLTLMLLACCSAELSADSSDNYQLITRSCSRRTSHGKKTCAAIPISRAGTIKRSGCYCLTKDIKGTITIAANNVSLDLNCHTVNGNGTQAAIRTNGFNDVTIKNGVVINPGSLGIRANNSKGFILDNVQISGSNRALAISNSFGSAINNVKIYDNLNVSDALILIDTCETTTLTNVEVFNNTKNLATPAANNTPPNALLCAVNSKNMIADGLLINNNQKTGGDNQLSRFAAILVLTSSNVVARNGQLNGNAVVVNDASRFQPFVIFGSSDVVIDGYQINGNSVQQSSAFRGILAQDSPRVVIKNTQVNDNTHQAAPPGPNGFISNRGIYLVSFSAPMDGCVISNCQVLRNTIVNPTIETPALFTEFEGIRVSNANQAPQPFTVPTIIENCQCNYNFIGGSDPGTYLAGILIDSTDDCIIRHCQCDYNQGSNSCFGINIDGEPDQNGVSGISRNVKVIECTGNNNTTDGPLAAGIAVCGFTLAPNFTDFVQNCQVIGGQFNYNFAGTNGVGFGIALQDTKGCSIENCEADANQSTGIFLGKFITVDVLSDNPHPINTDVTIIGCSAKENGANGFELSGIDATNSNCLLQDNVSLSNRAIGFLDTSGGAFNSRYLSNFAKGNGLLPYLIAGGAIQIFSLDNLGNYVHVSGDAVHFSELVNIQEP